MAFFLPYQQRWLADNARLKIFEKSRQVGLSWAAAYNAVREASVDSSRLDVWVSSRDETQARLFLDDCRKFARVLNMGMKSKGLPLMDTRGKSAHSLTFRSGRTIHSLSSNPDAQAGKRGTRILDEFALHPHPRQLYSIAYPGITWGGKLEIISTHRGSQSFFNQLVSEIKHGGNPKGVSLHTVTLPDALKEGFLQKLKSRLSPDDPRQKMTDDDYLQFIKDGCADEESWQQEYLCQPADDTTAVLPYEDICACEYSPQDYHEIDLVPAETSFAAEYYLGVDLGRTNDRTVMWLLEKQADILFTRRVTLLHRAPFATQEKILADHFALPGLRLCCIDATGFGMAFAERAARLFGQSRLESVTLTASLKEKLAYDLKQCFQQRRIRIPSQGDIRADLRAVKREHTSGDRIRITAERTSAGHSDRFWALALALRAAGQAPPALRYEAITLNRR